MSDGRSEDTIGPTRRNPRNGAVHLAKTEMDSFDIILLSKQISAVKRAFYGSTCPVIRKRKAPPRPAGDVWGVDRVDAARPSVLYASMGP